LYNIFIMMTSLKELTAKTISLNLNQECVDEIKNEIQRETYCYTATVMSRGGYFSTEIFNSFEDAEKYGKLLEKIQGDTFIITTNKIKFMEGIDDIISDIHSKFEIIIDTDDDKWQKSFPILNSMLDIIEKNKINIKKYEYLWSFIKGDLKVIKDEFMNDIQNTNYSKEEINIINKYMEKIDKLSI